jgi:hypothetical protein
VNYSEYFASTLTAIGSVHSRDRKKQKQDSFYPFLSTLHMASPTLSQALSPLLSLVSGLDTYHASDRVDPMRAVRRAQREYSNALRMVRTSGDQLERLTASVPHAGRAWTAAWQLPSQRASRAHQLTSKQHPWASRASVAARVVSRACPRLSQHWRRSPTKSRRCWQLPCRRNTID